MANRCNSTVKLEVHHKRIDGGNGLNNAEVLCHKCHENTSSYGHSDHPSPPPFSEKTKQDALKRAGYKCECMRINCHN